MPRDIPVCNGSLLVTFDREYNLRDVFFPYVGQENHTAGYPCRFGVWVDGRFSWLDGDDWRRELLYAPETLVTQVTAESTALRLRLRCADAVDFNRNVYLKQVEVDNLDDREREVRLFFHFDCHLYGVNIGDTAYFEPRRRALVHYKGQRYFWLNGQVAGDTGLFSYATGRKLHGDLRGTYVDAEDGELSHGAITQGSVDSVGSLSLQIPAGRMETAWWWLAAGYSYPEVEELDTLVVERTPAVMLARTQNYWRLWVNKTTREFADLPPRVVEQYKRSLLILRTQIDDNGAIIAANDSDMMQYGRDTYSYMWPRDGAYVAYALIHADHQSAARRFFQLCADHLSEEDCLLHKYNPDGSLGSSWHPWVNARGERQLPIQEDETALVLWALWEHYLRFHDLEFVKRVYTPLVRRAAGFLQRYRDPETGLPAPSYDLWEERYGIFTFTTAAVWAGLRAASRFASAFGDHELCQQYDEAADEIRAAMLRHLWDESSGRFLRGILFPENGRVRDPTVDSSLTALAQFGMLSRNDPRLIATMEAVEGRLWCRDGIGGIARYEDDGYHRVCSDVPGNPWILCTLWLADWHALRATRRAELGKTRMLLEWAIARTFPSGVLAEQVHPQTGEPLSVSPLTWSHATLVSSVHHYVARYLGLPER
jgi:GH15 family glucan-1,4-alpha-glucosidase